MNSVREILASKAPSAEFSESEPLTVTVPASELRAAALELRNDPRMQFDFLVSLTGMDWGDTLGVVYHLRSTASGSEIVLKTSTAEKENPELPTVSDIWKTANLNEREAYDFFGIRFVGHPDMRRLYLRSDWVGFPLRKDYDASPEINPIRLESEPMTDSAPTLVEKDGRVEAGENVLFDDSEYVVNIGPQHPATHGVLHFRVSLEGEIIKKVDPHCGYIHRGIEKMCESLTYPQMLALTDRLDYLSAHQNRHALCMCIEQAMGIEIPERVQYIRTIMDELNRLSSHLLFWSDRKSVV